MTRTAFVAASLLCTAFLSFSPGAHASERRCKDFKEQGITNLRAEGVSCAKAEDVALEFAHRIPNQQDRSRVWRWRCSAKRLSGTHESVICKRSGKRIRFRSTWAIELPPYGTRRCSNCAAGESPYP